MRYVHTNVVARDWRRLARFYEEVFECVRVPPSRALEGDWLALGTGVADAALEGVHLRLPGHGAAGPTLEIFTYRSTEGRATAPPDRVGYGHLAFEVADVAAALSRVIEHGGSRLGAVTEHQVPDVGLLTFVYARDPEGNALELQSWTTRELGADEAYALWAASYDGTDNRTRDADRAVVRAWLEEHPALGLAVLEVGCGTGKNTVALADAARVLGLDLSESMLARARERAPFAELRRHDLREPWPVEPASFDRVLANLVLEHIRDVTPIASEIARALRPGGRALLVELHPYRQLRGSQARFTDEASGEALKVEAYPHSVSELVGACLRAGLTLEAISEHDDAGAPCAPGAVPRLVGLRLRR